MKTKIKHISKRTLSILLAITMLFSMALVGMITSNAANMQGYIYFDNTNSNWSTVSILVGKNGWSDATTMTNIANTNLWYTNSVSWGDATEFCFFNGSWNDGTGSDSNISDRYGGVTHTAIHSLSSSYQFNSGKYHLFTPSGSSNNTAMTATYQNQSSYTSFNGNVQTVKMKVSTNGENGTYSESTSSGIATVKVTSAYLSAASTATQVTASNAAGNAIYNNSARGAINTLAYTISDSNYKFKGWYDSSGNSISTTYATTGATTSYAYFYKDIPAVATSVSLTASPTSVQRNQPITLTANLTGKVPSGNVTYTFSKTAGNDGSFSSSSVTTSNSTASVTYTPTSTDASKTYTFKVVVSATNYSSVENTANVTVTDSWRLLGNFSDPTDENQHWCNDYDYEFGTDNTVKVTLAAGKTYAFKVKNASDTWLGNTSTMTSTNCSNFAMTSNTGNCKITTTIAGEYTFTINKSTSKLSVTYPTPTNYTGLTINASGTDDGTNYNVTVTPSTLNLSASSGNSSTGVTATASTTADNYKLTGFTATNGTVSNVNLTAGTCTFKPSANNASVTAKYGKVYTVSTSSNNTALGTVSASPTSAAVGSTVTVTCTDVSGTFSSAVVKQGTTTVKSSTLKEFSFTMPAGNVNITATFTEYIGDSDYYYDGFGSNGGAVLSGFSNVQLNEGKINGSAYGYYSPSSAGRSGNDQLFLIKKKNSSGGTSTTRYVYFTRNKEIYDWYHYDTLYAYFYDDNGVVGNAWPGSGKSSYTTNSQGEKIFRFALPTSYSGTLKVVFNNGVGKKTSDITLNSGGYYVVDGTTSGDVYTNIGTWSPDSTNYPNAGLGSGSGSDDYTIFYNVENGNSNSAIYKSDSSYGATLNIYDHGANDAGGTYRRFSKVSTTSDYYIIVFYPGNTYTFDDKTFTVPSGNDPIVIASDTLPGVVSNSVTIYAKDGSIRSGYQKFAEMADTKITGTGVTATSYDYYEKAKVEKGSSVTITTTIGSGKRGKYYVRGFCVNGKTYGLTTKAEALASHTDGVYSFTLNIPSAETFADTFGDVNALEITPVYFYLNTTDVTTFYVKGFEGDVAKAWGNTVACHVYYNGGSDTSTDDNVQNAFGGFPGQPMIYTGGRYMIEIPTYIDSSQTKSVMGITLNNYYHDSIHNLLGFASDNQQTYDYDDFDRIRTLNDKKDIIFTFKFKKTIDNPNSCATTGTGTTTFQGASYYTNGFEYLYNAQGKKIDLFGNVIPSTSTASPVYVVSNGYENYNETVGKYATSWSIYPSGATSGTARTAVMAPSVRFAADADSVASYYDNNDQGNTFKTAYNAVKNANYLNHPVFITYEKALWNGDSNTTAAGGDQAQRCDGVWSYSKASDYISSNIKIEYGPSATGTFTTDTFTDTHVGTETGCEAYFTNEAFYGAVTSPSQYADASSNYELHADADSAGRYMFLGWYLLSEGVYTKLDDWFVSETTSPMTTSDTYVARFITTPAGSVRFTHDLFKNAPTLTTMPTVHTGTGKTYIKVDVIDPDRGDAVVATYGNTTSAESANVPATYITATSTYKLRVTLTTIPTGLNTLTAMYENDETHNEYMSITLSGTTGTITTTREINIVDMFDNNLDLRYNNVEYYSDITPVTKNYKITFNYTDRFGETKSYIKKGTLTESFVATHNDGTQASIYIDKAFIMNLAPYEDNFSEVIRWNDSAISDGKITSSGTSDITYTVSSNQTAQTVNLKYNSSYLTNGPLNTSKDYAYGSLVLKDGSTTEFSLKAPATNPDNADEKFSYWEIKTTDGKLVAKNYSVYFNYRLYDDYVIRPIYSTNPEKYNTANVSTTIQFLEYSRNQWTDANGVSFPSTDKLFADFAVAFNKNGELINPSSNNCGIIFAIGDTSVYDEGNINTNLTGVSFTTNEDSLKAYIKSGSTYTQGSSDTKTVKKLSINSLDNKNRVEVYSAFKNQTTNTYPVIKVYSYIVDGDQVCLSDPIFINLYDTSVATYK